MMSITPKMRGNVLGLRPPVFELQIRFISFPLPKMIFISVCDTMYILCDFTNHLAAGESGNPSSPLYTHSVIYLSIGTADMFMKCRLYLPHPSGEQTISILKYLPVYS